MKKYLFMFTVCSFLFCCQQDNAAEEQEIQEEPYQMSCGCGDRFPPEDPSCQKELVWDYPVKPGMEEWEQFYYASEAKEALQIPEEILFSLSTEDLAKICLQYPFLYLRDNRNISLDRLFDEFNGIRELFTRENVLQELLKQYRCLMFRLANEDISEDKRANIWIGTAGPLECLLTRCYSQDKNDYLNVLQHLVCGYEIFSKEYNNSTAVDNFFSRAHVIIKIDEQYIEKIPEGNNNSVFRNGTSTKQSLQIIDELSCQLINNT